jgi:hypothetical protein
MAGPCPGRSHLSYADRIRTVLFEAGTRPMEARKASEQAMSDIMEALHCGDGILSVVEMSRLSGVAKSEIPGPGEAVRPTTNTTLAKESHRCAN